MSGLRMTASCNTVKGLAIHRFSANGILRQTGGGNTIQGNSLGANAAGTATAADAASGIDVRTAGNTIGGAAADEGNQISGNTRGGVALTEKTAKRNVLQGNRIGTNPAGTAALANGGSGVTISEGSDNTIGGQGAGQGNTIARNVSSGVYVAGATSVRNAIRQNSLFQNGLWGIDVAPYGRTPNDPDDPDAGTNQGQNFAVLTTAVMNGENSAVTYSLPSATANSAYPLTVEFFLADADGQEGQTWLGSQSYAAPGAATATLAQCYIPLGVRLVATATGATGNTSEFSASLTVIAALSAPTAAAGRVSAAGTLDEASLAPVVWLAVAAWESAGLAPARAAALESVSFEIADLPGRYLGWASPNRIVLDADAAGYGCYVNSCPNSGSPRSALDSRLSIGLLTAVMHEMGHALGLPDLDDEDELMGDVLGLGARRLPTTADVDRVHELGSWLASSLPGPT